ncbi:ABC transporter substrate-binding protein [Ktedonospora formicarum]|uniref:Sugar ABC transporter substrate-binding protein n=1 Tax=Ktedonospora formicarum TaxID=2778364 RepID=A0A8J3HZD0_9CHLR|nr:sugar ABC transporter substrate-binding protein [Ktedonospora formicarum]GHO46529.1 sugar ABC transporter substrate-binding protein [Ktedonospora formicarum]
MDIDRPLLSELTDTSISRRGFLKRAGYGGMAALGTTSIAALMSSCGGSTSSGPMSFWQFYGPNGTVKSQSQWFVDLVNNWNKSEKAQIKLEYIPNTDYISGSKLQTAFASGQGPDIFIISPGDFLRYYNGGVLQDLTLHIDKNAQSDLYPDVMSTRTIDGKIYAVPMEVEPMAFYYSIEAFEQAGLNENDVPKTWDELLEIGDKLKTNKRSGIIFEPTPGYYQNFTWYPFMWQGGGEVVDAGGKKSTFNSPATIQALQFWQDAVKRGITPRTVVGGGGDTVANLAAGRCAIQNAGIWGVSDLKNNAPKFKYGVFKLPIPTGGTYKTVLGGWAFVANAKGKNPDEAARFCAWALASMQPDSIQRGVDWISKAKSDVGPRKSVMDQATKDNAFAEGALKTFKEEIFPGGRAEPRFPPEIYKPISDAIQACMLNGADPRQEAEKASKAIDTFLGSYKGGSIV